MNPYPEVGSQFVATQTLEHGIQPDLEHATARPRKRKAAADTSCAALTTRLKSRKTNVIPTTGSRV